MPNKSVTRGNGLLEKYLSIKRSEMANKLIPEDRRNGKILDIGCGTSPYFLLNTRFNKKYGLDQYAKLNGSNNIILKKFNITAKERLPFLSNYFDIITMLAVFEHIEPDHLSYILSEILRILKVNGKFIMTTPCVWADKLLRMMAKINLVSSEEINEHKGAYNHDNIANYLKKAGFKKKNMEFGYFELFLNNWCSAKKDSLQ